MHHKLQFNNLTTSWKDGIAFCALLTALGFDSEIQFDKLDRTSSNAAAAKRLELAFSVAEKHGVARMLDVEDMIEFDVPDKFSVSTYLSSMHKAWC